MTYILQTAGEYVPPHKTIWTPREAVAYFDDALTGLLGKARKPETVALLVAQSALESARWEACWNNNPSNIKHGAKRTRQFTCIRLNEVLDGKVKWFDPDSPLNTPSDGPTPVPPGHPQTRMRAFANGPDGVADKLAFLTTGRWKPAFEAARTGSAPNYITAIHSLGYFTAPLNPYVRAVASLQRTYIGMAREEIGEPRELSPLEEDALRADMRLVLRYEFPEWLQIVGANIAAELHENLADKSARDALIREQDN